MRLASLRSQQQQRHGPSERFGYVSVVDGDDYYLLGGYDGDRWLNDFWSFSLTKREWKLLPPPDPPSSLPSIRSCPCWSVVPFHPITGSPDRTLLLMGGYDGSNRMNDFHYYSFSLRKWGMMPCQSKGRPSQRYFHR